MQNAYVWFNGQVIPATEARVSPLSRGWMLGEGVFETMVWRAGRIEALRRHWLRLCDGASRLGLEAPPLDEMKAALHSVAEANVGWHRLRYAIARGESGCVDVCASAAKLAEWPEVERVTLVPWLRNAHSPLAGIKCASYAENVLTARHAQQRRCGEGLLANTSGHLCEGSGSNVFVVVKDKLVTPPLHSGCLPGITRGLVLESGVAEERDLPQEALHHITEMFLTSSTRGVQAVGEVDGRELPVVNGPLTQKAREALRQALARE